MSQDWTSDNNDSDKFEWESDGEAEPSSAPTFRNLDAAGPSTLVRWIVIDRNLCLLEQELAMFFFIILVLFWS